MLKIAERFLSIQGEGRYAGYPAYFVRLSGCNFLCNWLKKDGTRELCDTEAVWKNTKEELSVQELLEKIYALKLPDNTHVIVTGGEPLLQNEQLKKFIATCKYFTELETSGSLKSSLYPSFTHINWSPKLKSAGYGIEYYRKLGMVEFWKGYASVLSKMGKLDLKIVVATEDDVKEVRQWCEELRFPKNRVFLMPVSNTRKELAENSEWVVEICKKEGFNYSSRLQLLIWDKTIIGK